MDLHSVPQPRISRRAETNLSDNATSRIMRAGYSSSYNATTNPEGMISMGIAENKLMHPTIIDQLNKRLHITHRMLTYGDGSIGSNELRDLLSGFMTRNFKPKQEILRQHLTIINGISSVIDNVTFCLCEEGEGILLGRPLYVGFISDLVNRAKVKPVMVNFGEKDPLSVEAVKDVEQALLLSEADGTPIRALILSHPHNPLGECYSIEALQAYLKLCAKYNIHLVSDEVYALSVFTSKDRPSPRPFTSVLAMDIENLINPALVHVLYGMSKDFCSNGIRIGAFVSQHNETMHRAMRAISKFAWASSLADMAWCSLLDDQSFLDSYFATLKTLLTESYDYCTDFLKGMDIDYVPANAGPFVWLDLSKYLSGKTVEAERELAWKLIEGKVWLATGEAFRAEQPGWFRLTFAIPTPDLDVGLKRLGGVLSKVN